MTERVLITGMACATAFGLHKENLIQAITRGECALKDSLGEVQGVPVTQVGLLARGQSLGVGGSDDPTDFCARLVSLVAKDALDDAGLAAPLDPQSQLPLLLASSYGNPLDYFGLLAVRDGSSASDVVDELASLPFREDTLTRQIQEQLGCSLEPVGLCMQCASSILAISMAAGMIKSGSATRVLVGAYDLYQPFFYLMLRQSGLLDAARMDPYGVHHRGMNVGDCAAVFVLESETEARRHAAPRCYGEIASSAVRGEPGHSVKAISDTIAESLARANLTPAQIDLISPHACAIADHDRNESLALTRVFGPKLHDVPVGVYTGYAGYSFAASGFLDLVVALTGMQTRRIFASSGPDLPDEVSQFNFVRDGTKEVEVKHMLKVKLGYSGAIGALVVSSFALG